MNKKGSMELSVNSIVILVIAVTLLGLILGFITTKMKEVKITPPAQEAPEANAAAPVTVSSNPFALNSGKGSTIGVNVYNTYTYDLKDVVPIITCTDTTMNTAIGTTADFEATSIAAAKSYSFAAVIKVTVPRDQYLCRIKVTGKNATNQEEIIGSKDFSIQVE